MSIFDKLVGAGKSGDITGRAESTVRSGISKAAGFASSAAGGGKTAGVLGRMASGMGNQAVSAAMDKHLPPSLRSGINAGADVLGQLASGDFDGGIASAIEALTGSGLVGLPGLSFGADRGAADQKFWSGQNMLYGGISPAEAIKIHREAREARRSKKNLFLLKVRSNLVGDYSHEFNLFCTDIERGFGEVSGGKVRAGSAVLDTLQQLEAGMVRITTFDDQAGTLKRWFLDHSAAQAARDGSFGVPADYAIEILLQHSFVGDAGGFTGKGWYRAQSCETGLSRREDAMEELQMTFTQLDTFMR